MTEDTRANESVEVQAQQEPMPSSNEQGEKINQSQGEVTKKVTEPNLEELELPADASDRTREQFDKLKNQLAVAKQELEAKKERESVFESMRKQNVQPNVAGNTVTARDFVDAEGYVDLEKLESRLSAADRALEAVEEMRAFSAHPELDPDSDKYDPEFKDETRRILLDSMVYPQAYGNKTLSLKAAADKAKQRFSRVQEVVREEATNQVVENLSQKESASLEAIGRSDRRREANSSLEDLSVRTRHGDKSALVERLKQIPIEGRA